MTTAAPAKNERTGHKPDIPYGIDMYSSPIGHIPAVTGPEGEVVRFPAYWHDLLAAASIRYRGHGWAIVIEEKASIKMKAGRTETVLRYSTQKHDRFIMLLDVCCCLTAKWLYANGYEGIAEKLNGMSRDDQLECALGRKTTVRLRFGQETIVASVDRMTDLLKMGTQQLFDWLALESKEPKYQVKRKIFEEDLPDL